MISVHDAAIHFAEVYAVVLIDQEQSRYTASRLATEAVKQMVLADGFDNKTAIRMAALAQAEDRKTMIDEDC